MSGSLDRLILGAQGRLPAPEPLLPSRYAPLRPGSPFEAAAPAPARAVLAAASEPAAAIFEERQEPSATVRVIPPAAPPGPLAAVAPAPIRVPPRAAPIPAAQLAAGAVANVPPPFDMRTVQAAVRTATESAGPPEPPGRGDAPQPQAATVAETTWRDPPPPPPPPPHQPPFLERTAPVSRLAGPPALAPLPPNRAPEVHISIGHVEVHAAPARSAPARPAPVRPPPMSLADYKALRK